MDIESKLMEILREFELKSKEETTYHELYHGGAIPKIKQLVRESLPEKMAIPDDWQYGYNDALEQIEKVWGD